MDTSNLDAIIVGGGTKALSLGIYLQKFGGMQVGIFESRHELGGGMSSEESPAPGFIADHHATGIADWYWEVALQDFPELADRGLQWIPSQIPLGGIFLEDSDCWMMYGPGEDPSGEKTAKVFERFSPKDAETFIKIWAAWQEVARPALVKAMHSVAPPCREPDALEQAIPEFVRRIGLEEPICYIQNPFEVFRDLFESDALIAGMFRIAHSWDAASPLEYGMGVMKLLTLLGFTDYGCLKGGTHSSAHATYKVFTENGGRCFTENEVDKVIIENNKAVGIKIKDGPEVKADKLVVSTLSPRQLVFDITGKEHWPWRVARRVDGLADWRICITWYTWALHELPRYDKAVDIFPDMQRVGQISLGEKEIDSLVRNTCRRYLGQWDWGSNLVVVQDSMIDRTRVPDHKESILTEDYQPAAWNFTDDQWQELKKKHAGQVMDTLGKVAPNMTWDNVIGYNTCTPFDHCHLANMAPAGNWGIIDHVPTQLGKYRPIPELARHKTPIDRLYATGSAWPITAGCWPGQGYTCYKVIADDFDLNKPWEDAGRDY